MAIENRNATRFPWVYFAAALMPAGVIAVAMFLPEITRSPDAMGPAMLCSLLIAPVGAAVTLWGIIRLWRGEDSRVPALQWLVWVPALSAVAGLLLA